MKKRRSHIKIVGEPVIEMSPYKSLGLKPEELVALKGNLNGCLRFYQSRIDDSNHTHVVIDRVISVFSQGNSAGSNNN